MGIILNTNRFVRVIANAPAEALVDRIGTRTPFVAGLFIDGIATLSYIVAIRSALPEAWFILARVCWGFGSALAYATSIPETHVSDAKTSVKPREIETSVPALTVGLVNFGLYFAVSRRALLDARPLPRCIRLRRLRLRPAGVLRYTDGDHGARRRGVHVRRGRA